MNEYLPTICVLIFGFSIGGVSLAILPGYKRELRREREEEEEQFYREIYGPGGKPKKEPTEQQSPEAPRA
jgi:hypothetical protein